MGKNIWQYLALSSMGADLFALTRFLTYGMFYLLSECFRKKATLIANFLISTFVHSYLLVTFESLYSMKFLRSFFPDAGFYLERFFITFLPIAVFNFETGFMLMN